MFALFMTLRLFFFDTDYFNTVYSLLHIFEKQLKNLPQIQTGHNHPLFLPLYPIWIFTAPLDLCLIALPFLWADI